MASPNSTAPVPQPSPTANPAPDPRLANLLPLTAEDFRSNFVVGPDNQMSEFVYEVDPTLQPVLHERFDEALDKLRADRSEPTPQFVTMWRGNSDLSVFAAERAQHLLLVDQTTGRPIAGVKRVARSYQSPKAHFPTLENQKIADRAYKLLGLEPDPLSAEDLERVKKLGYSGGLKVAQVIGETGGANGRLQVGNLLVGLHVWPVTDLASLDEILRRPDLGDLTPLKYYAVREAEGGLNSSKNGDELTTGRLSIPEAALLSRDLATTDRLQAEMAAIQIPSDYTPITVVQAPNTHRTSLFGGSITTAYLKVKFDRLPDTFDNAGTRLSPQEIERSATNCLAVIKSPDVLKAALAVITPHETDDVKPEEAADWLKNRLNATFPGDGEILELKLEGGDAKEDIALLQAVIDAFMAAMKVDIAPTDAPPDQGQLPPAPADSFLPLAHAEGVQLSKEFPAETDPNEIEAFAKPYREEGYEVLIHRYPDSGNFTVVVAKKLRTQLAGATTNASPTFLYDGKTFDQWRDLWKLELNPGRRTDAINALAAFGRAGYGEEAADAILDVAGEYLDNYAANSPEAQLRSAIEAAVVRMPAELWLPPLMKRMAEDNAKWRRLASQLLYGYYERSLNERGQAQTSPQTIELLKLMARDPKYGPNALPLDTLIRLLPKGDAELDQLITEALADEDKQNAVDVVGNLSYSRLDQFPEQFKFLFHNDPKIRRYARRVLPQASAKDAIAVADRLKAVLTDPQRSADHADAVRAMGEMIRSIAKGGSSRLGSSVNAEDFEKKFQRPVERLLNEGPPELLTSSLVALGYKADDSSLIEQRLGDGLSAERKSLIQETLKKLAAEEKEVLPRQLGF